MTIAASLNSRIPTGRPRPAPEEIYLALLAPNLQPNPAVEAVKSLLRLAQQDGLDPQALYRQAVRERPLDWPPAPSLEAVLPQEA